MTEIVTLIATLTAKPVGGLGAALLQRAASVGAVHVIYGSLTDKNTDVCDDTLRKAHDSPWISALWLKS